MADPLIADVERELDIGDLAALNEPANSKAPALQRISDRHHRLARLLAEGMSPAEAGMACSYVPSRVSILQADPSFQALVAMYREKLDHVYNDLHERLKSLAATAADELLHRLEDAPDGFETGDLTKLVALGADRTGHGPSSTTQHNIFHGFAERLDKARARRIAAEDATVIKEGDL